MKKFLVNYLENPEIGFKMKRNQCQNRKSKSNKFDYNNQQGLIKQFDKQSITLKQSISRIVKTLFSI